MQANQIWEALENERPVTLHDEYLGELSFQKVAAVISRKDKAGVIHHSAELLDKNGTSVVIADPKKIRYA